LRKDHLTMPQTKFSDNRSISSVQGDDLSLFLDLAAPKRGQSNYYKQI
jgi:hypothetical protein